MTPTSIRDRCPAKYTISEHNQVKAHKQLVISETSSTLWLHLVRWKDTKEGGGGVWGVWCEREEG